MHRAIARHLEGRIPGADLVSPEQEPARADGADDLAQGVDVHTEALARTEYDGSAVPSEDVRRHGWRLHSHAQDEQQYGTEHSGAHEEHRHDAAVSARAFRQAVAGAAVAPFAECAT